MIQRNIRYRGKNRKLKDTKKDRTNKEKNKTDKSKEKNFKKNKTDKKSKGGIKKKQIFFIKGGCMPILMLEQKKLW